MHIDCGIRNSDFMIGMEVPSEDGKMSVFVAMDANQARLFAHLLLELADQSDAKKPAALGTANENPKSS